MFAVKDNVALEVKKNVLADFIDHNIVLSFLYDIGFVEKNNYNGIVILEREDEEEFSLVGVMVDEKNKNYRAQLINTLYTIADILDVNFDYLLSNILASYSNKTMKVYGLKDTDSLETIKNKYLSWSAVQNLEISSWVKGD